MIKKITLFIYLINLIAFSQGEDYYIVNGKKTFCSNLSFKLTPQSYLKSISYIDNDGNKVEIKGRKKVPNISTFLINGTLIDKIPQKTNKPDKYVKWAKRIVSGKLIVNFYNSSLTTMDSSGSTTTTGITKYFVKMPNGTYYNLRSSKDRKKYIIPYLKKCAEFNSKYKGSFKKDEFNKIIRLYNRSCK